MVYGSDRGSPAPSSFARQLQSPGGLCNKRTALVDNESRRTPDGAQDIAFPATRRSYSARARALAKVPPPDCYCRPCSRASLPSNDGAERQRLARSLGKDRERRPQRRRLPCPGSGRSAAWPASSLVSVPRGGTQWKDRWRTRVFPNGPLDTIAAVRIEREGGWVVAAGGRSGPWYHPCVSTSSTLPAGLNARAAGAPRLRPRALSSRHASPKRHRRRARRLVEAARPDRGIGQYSLL